MLVCLGRFTGGGRGFIGNSRGWAGESLLSAGLFEPKLGGTPSASGMMLWGPSGGFCWGGLDNSEVRDTGLKSRGITRSSCICGSDGTFSTFAGKGGFGKGGLSKYDAWEATVEVKLVK